MTAVDAHIEYSRLCRDCLAAIRKVSDAQAEDARLWPLERVTPREQYTRDALRYLHAVIEQQYDRLLEWAEDREPA